MRVFFTFQFAEKPLGYSGDKQEHNGRKNGKGNDQAYPKLLVQASLTVAHDNRQNDEHGGVCQNRSANGDGNRLVFCNAEFTYNGVCDECMCGEHTRRKKTGVEVVFQEIIAHGEADTEWNNKREYAKQQALVAVGFKLIQVEFEAGNEHDIQQADGGKQIDGGIFFQDVQTVRPDYYTGYNQTDYSRNIDPAQQYRRQQDDK